MNAPLTWCLATQVYQLLIWNEEDGGVIEAFEEGKETRLLPLRRF